ncbi:MBL fold metallo-hydrolase [Streptomyces doebereineriae]|uniref:MBL fold metallo-hydrolase n=1 Tax=Streptomyces doebereineriae TaxID=3075528 RepID=A0ABU2VF81_9ACTN|nr:MBL fold metallo-hydrolase [Streptomyces sp. DSM 41640]MDT0483925.1 MBL fold metallo-hydrolase [Streptomyces sp. DSM 41640]
MNEPHTAPVRQASPEVRPHGALTRRRLWQLGAAAALTAGAASLLPGRASAETSASALPAAQDYFDRAAELAGDNPVLKSIVSALTAGYTPPRPAAPAPLRIFDNVAVLSVGFVSATAILTPGGIILIDALDNADEAEQYIVSGLRSLGADPSTIKYVVVTHGHGDHFGGAQYLADRYGARVMMAPADWDLLASTSPANAPTRDLDIADGQKLTLGGTTVTLHHTPGHTPGTVSPIFPARWRGRTHTAMLWGGTNPPAATASKETYLSSALTFASRARRAGVDVELSNHGFADYGLERMEDLRSTPNGRQNPFVVGTSTAQRFMKIVETMLRGRIAQDQQAATTTATTMAATSAPTAGCC